MTKRPMLILNYRIMTMFSGLFWCASLAMTGIALYSKQQRLLGVEILSMGWLSPLVLNFAWFSNLFILYAFFRLLKGKSATKSSIIAVILSLDTFRFNLYMLNEGGATTPVYGYGWGAVFWFISIALLLVAAGSIQIQDKQKEESISNNVWLKPLGLFLFILIVSLSAYFSVNDRVIANSYERERLTGLAFKRGKVCSSPEPSVTEPILNFDGPLEVVIEKNAVHAKYPFSRVEDLLRWGIPIVRVGSYDYSSSSTVKSYGIGGTGNINKSTMREKLLPIKAVGEPAAILYVTEGRTPDGYTSSISAKLIESSTKRMVFNHTWTREDLPINHNYYCPDYHSFPSLNKQPRLLLLEALRFVSNE